MSILTAKFLLVRLTRRQAIESVGLGLNPDLIVYCYMVLGESSCLCLCFVLFCFDPLKIEDCVYDFQTEWQNICN